MCAHIFPMISSTLKTSPPPDLTPPPTRSAITATAASIQFIAQCDPSTLRLLHHKLMSPRNLRTFRLIIKYTRILNYGYNSSGHGSE